MILVIDNYDSFTLNLVRCRADPPAIDRPTMEPEMDATDVGNAKIHVPCERIEAFCRKWHVAELALFGSVLRDDFRADSDVDVLVTFEHAFRPCLDDLLDMEDELADAFGRRVDLTEKARVENPFIRREILHTQRVLYAA